MTWREAFPEADCVDAGDPYISMIVNCDDIICDYTYNFEFLRVSEEEAAKVARECEQQRLSYELELLYKWWGLAAKGE